MEGPELLSPGLKSKKQTVIGTDKKDLWEGVSLNWAWLAGLLSSLVLCGEGLKSLLRGVIEQNIY
jgi:hypothetical protein